MSWASRRRTIYIGSFLSVVLIVALVLFFYVIYEPPTCFDGERNGDEEGVDCGGSCARVCSVETEEPVVLWSRLFEVFPNRYTLVALVENPNVNTVARDVPYRFSLRDGAGRIITDVEGAIDVPRNTRFVVFESNIEITERQPVGAFFEFTETPEWERPQVPLPHLPVSETVFSSTTTVPRLTATIENLSLETLLNVDVFAIVYDPDGNSVAASRTLIEQFNPETKRSIVFTWPQPFDIASVACTQPVGAILVIDRSGSMNDDNTDPPQPLTDVRNAAQTFTATLSGNDPIGVISFATGATLDQAPVVDKATVNSAIQGVSILPEDEEGFTNIGAALQLARETVTGLLSFQTNAHPFVVVLLTDGQANYPIDPGGEPFAELAATALKNQNIELFTIGLGGAVNADFLRSIATSPDHFFSAVNTLGLEDIYRTIATTICERGPAVIEVYPQIPPFEQRP